MQKEKLDKFIQKYSLGGNVTSVKWKSDGDSLMTSFITPDKSLLGTVKVDNFKFEDAELGVYQTDRLQRLLGVLETDVDLNLSKIGDRALTLKVKNNKVSVDYVLSDLSVIPSPPDLKSLPEFGTSIKIDSHFIDTFIKGKSALADVDMFSVVKEKDGCEVVIGYSSTNTNRVNISVDCNKCNVEEPITFNANLFKEVLVANKECKSAILEVSNNGLARINFKIGEYDSTYYIVAMQDVD
jgi:hypothetical protein